MTSKRTFPWGSWLIFIFLFTLAVIKINMTPVYETEAVVMLDSKKSPTSLDSETEDIKSSISHLRNHMELMQSYDVLRKVVVDFKLDEDESWESSVMHKASSFLQKEEPSANPDNDKEKRIRETVGRLKENYLNLESPPFTNLVHIRVRYHDPEKTAAIANSLTQEYIRWTTNFFHKEIDAMLEYLDNEVRKSQEKLLQSEKELAQYRQKHNILSPDNELKAYIERLAQLEMDYILTYVQEEELKERVELIKNELDKEKGNITSLSATNNLLIQNMQTTLLQLKIELSQLRELYSDSSPQVAAMKERISMVEKNLNEEFAKLLPSKASLSTVSPAYSSMVGHLIEDETNLGALGPKKDAINKLSDAYKKDLVNIPSQHMEYFQLLRNTDLQVKIYTFLVQELEKVQLYKAKETTDRIQIVGEALVPQRQKGRLKRIALAGLVSFLAAVSLPHLFLKLSIRFN